MKKAAAFTLIELLVVMGIIALLAGLLFPIISRSLASARTTQCLSNLRQIAIAIPAYMHDHNGCLPVLQNRASTNDPVPALDTVLLPAMSGSRGVFRCSADNKHLFESTGTSYYWNFTVNGQTVSGLFSIIGGDKPTRVPLVSDKEAFHPDTPDRVNILYADGHVSKELRFSTSLP